MLYVALGLAVLFVFIGYIINEGNAKTLLSQYRAMSPEERQSFDLTGYLSEFKSFHWFLGLTMAGSSFLIDSFGNEEMMVFLLGIYPLLGYAYFIYKTKGYNSEKEKKRAPYYAGILIFLSLIVGAMFVYSTAGNEISVEENMLKISGMYGEEIPLESITSVELTESIPDLKMRVNGSAIGSKLVGYFKTEADERVKLFLDKSRSDFIRILAEERPAIYFNSADTKADYNRIVNKLNK